MLYLFKDNYSTAAFIFFSEWGLDALLVVPMNEVNGGGGKGIG